MNTLLFIPNLIYTTLFHKEPNPSVQIRTQGLNFFFFLDGEDGFFQSYEYRSLYSKSCYCKEETHSLFHLKINKLLDLLSIPSYEVSCPITETPNSFDRDSGSFREASKLTTCRNRSALAIFF